MASRHLTRVGDGSPAVVLQEVQRNFPALQVIHRGDDIQRPTDWRINESTHSIIVHLGGRMDHLETELDGAGGSSGGALPGEIWTVPAGRSYASHARGKVIEYAVLRLQPAAADKVQDTCHGLRNIKAVAGVRNDFLHHATLQLVQVMRESDDVSAMLAEALGQTISLNVLRSLAPDGPMARTREAGGPVFNGRICRALRDYILDRLEERLSLSELAALAGLTTHHFLIAFRKAFGNSPGQYIIQQRLRAAQRLLLHSRKDITTIALECGFSSHSHLSASFTKAFGCPPSVFRDTARRHEIPAWRAD